MTMRKSFTNMMLPNIVSIFTFVISLSCFFQLFLNDESIVDTNIITTVESRPVLITSAFCLGFQCILFFDIGIDLYLKDCQLIVTRTFLLCAATIFYLLFIIVPDGLLLARLVLCYVGFLQISCVGRALVDLVALDSTNVWTSRRAILILITIGATAWTNALEGNGRIFNLIIKCVFIASFLITSLKCCWKYYLKPRDSFCLEDTIVIFVMSSVATTIVGYAIVPGSFTNYGPFQNSTPGHMCSLQLIYLGLICCLTLFPSFLLRQRSLKLQSDLDTKKSFVRYVSHEIRTPMNVASLALELIANELKEKPDCVHLLDMVNDAQDCAETAVNILSDLLSYEKLESDIMTLEQSSCRLVPFIEEKLRTFQLQATHKDIELQVLPGLGEEERDVFVHIDQNKMAQVLRNFVSNAIKFTPNNGKVTVTLSILKKGTSAEQRGISSPGTPSQLPRVASLKRMSSAIAPTHATVDYVRVTISDTGFGISAENQAKLFNEVVQFHAAAHQGGGGSGLGLWITKRIVRLHEGRVGVESAGEGHGSRFYFDLPIEKVDEGWQAEEERVVALRVSATSQAQAVHMRLHVLVVDDSALNRKMTVKTLENLGHTYAEANDGDVAVQRVEASLQARRPYDAVLIGNLMPRMCGPDAAKAMRGLGYTGLVVGVTGNALPEDISHFLDFGADKILVKPVKLAEIQETLTACAMKIMNATDNAWDSNE